MLHVLGIMLEVIGGFVGLLTLIIVAFYMLTRGTNPFQ